jgi:SAM-dependent methyltransferase
LLTSCLCTEQRLRSPEFQNWCALLGESPGHLHRKIWEFCFICEALAERGLLSSATRGLGFAVGQEPLSSLFASCGVDIVATDLATEEAQKIGWVDTGEHASGIAALNKRNLCDPKVFSERVGFQFCDMNNISAAFDGKFDFVWSACAFEHLGSIKLGQEFVYNSIECLKPGGVAVHTTEYNISSKTETVDNEGTVIYRQCDIQEIINTLLRQGHSVEMDWNEGNGAADQFIDVAPYAHNPHLKLQLGKYVTTSIGLIIRKRI